MGFSFGWVDITSLHVTASSLDSSLKSFSLVKDATEWKNLLEQAFHAAKENILLCILVTDNQLEDNDIEDTAAKTLDNDVASKKAAALDTSNRSDHASKDFEAGVE